MKLTRTQLRQLIIEAARTIIVDPKGVATPADKAYRSGLEKDKRISQMHPKLGSIMSGDAADRRQARQLADVLPLDDESLRPEALTSAEEFAVDRLGEKSLEQDDPVRYDFPVVGEQIVDFIKGGKKLILKKLGVKYVKDDGYNTPQNTFYHSPTGLQDAANALNCKPDEVAYTLAKDLITQQILNVVLDRPTAQVLASNPGSITTSHKNGSTYDLGVIFYHHKDGTLHFKG